MVEIASIQEPPSLKLITPLPLNQHPALVYLETLGVGSRRTMRQSLNKIAEIISNGECDAYTLDWSKLRYRHTITIRNVLASRYAATTVNKMLCALRRVLEEACKLELLPDKDWAKAREVKDLKVSRKLRGRALNSEEISSLVYSCLQTEHPLDVRDGALIAILRGSGIRRAELVKLQLSDYEAETGTILIRSGKGDKDRFVYLPTEAMVWVSRWLEVRGNQPGALLCPVRKGGKVIIREMCSDAVLKILKARANQLGLESFSPHDLRRTFCSDLLDAGVDIVTVQRLAGHSSPATTAKYDRRGEETKRQAVQSLKF